eukprot:512192_1
MSTYSNTTNGCPLAVEALQIGLGTRTVPVSHIALTPRNSPWSIVTSSSTFLPCLQKNRLLVLFASVITLTSAPPSPPIPLCRSNLAVNEGSPIASPIELLKADTSAP